MAKLTLIPAQPVAPPPPTVVLEMTEEEAKRLRAALGALSGPRHVSCYGVFSVLHDQFGRNANYSDEAYEHIFGGRK